MGSVAQELPDITILNDSNFHRWAMEIELTMKGKKLWKFVIDNNINDSEDPSKFMAMAFIVRTVDETNFHRISGCDSVKQMMDKLIQYHRGCSSKSTESLLQKSYEISWSEDIEATFSQVRRINGKLKARGVLKTMELCISLPLLVFHNRMVKLRETYEQWLNILLPYYRVKVCLFVSGMKH